MSSHDEETSDNESRRVTEDNIASPDDFDPNGDDEGVESEELTRYYVQFLYLISTLTLRYFKYCTQLKLYMKKITNWNYFDEKSWKHT